MESVVSMAGQLGYETIAEGVEEEEQYDFMKEIGCSIIQGYYLGKPMPEEETDQLLQSLANRKDT